MIDRRQGLLGTLAWASALSARAAAPPVSDAPAALDREQSRRFRAWMTLLVHRQVDRGPTPRWTHRDCAGLVRFVVADTLREHDQDWKRANGLLQTRLPPDLDLAAALALRHTWKRVDGARDAYVGALELVQENTRLLGRQLHQAEPGDLLFYDLGDDQHLMVWMGRYIAYHTGRALPGDNGLRAVTPGQLMGWSDTRWRPADNNPNFSGVYRLAFLTP
jgi:uncharacterized protein